MELHVLPVSGIPVILHMYFIQIFPKAGKGREKVLNGKERFGFINLLLWLSFQSACGKGQGGISEIFG